MRATSSGTTTRTACGFTSSAVPEPAVQGAAVRRSRVTVRTVEGDGGRSAGQERRLPRARRRLLRNIRACQAANPVRQGSEAEPIGRTTLPARRLRSVCGWQPRGWCFQSRSPMVVGHLGALGLPDPLAQRLGREPSDRPGCPRESCSFWCSSGDSFPDFRLFNTNILVCPSGGGMARAGAVHPGTRRGAGAVGVLAVHPRIHRHCEPPENLRPAIVDAEALDPLG